MFRPLPVLTAVTLPALALLIWLGAWQWGRMGDKAEAIAAWEMRAISAPVSLEEALCGDAGPVIGRLVLPPREADERSIRYQGRSLSGEPGWRLVHAVPLPACFGDGMGAPVLVQWGFEPLRGGETVISETLTITTPSAAGAFTPPNEVEARIFYRFEPDELGAALGVENIETTFWLIEGSDELPAELAQVPPGQHLGYALTWWGIALGLMGVYLVLHVQQGRLRFTRR
ncbi:SURF1 family protein [Hyphobacterium sp. HN65]|uniref:SURF1-like protein n=1 Tax=Hyphobacterium lacteum TaxID=3116575 RepID=A0ABU7LN28_9PROT|nr:SURF1 family protein [Hyphobacterium sp. HN65]MEE2525304.1 SURF1 family protein [Hyphobacterium sp. HN65]